MDERITSLQSQNPSSDDQRPAAIANAAHKDHPSLIAIPSDYAEQGVVPIFIRTKNGKGKHIYYGWIDAIEPVAGRLRRAAYTILGDVRRVSEITEAAVHGLFAKHGRRLGRSPSNQIYASARWRARDLAAGGGRRRKGLDTDLPDAMLANLRDSTNFAEIYETREFIERLIAELHERGLSDVAAQVHAYLFESEEAAMLNAPRGSQAWNTIYHRFVYRLRQAAKSLEARDPRR